jgi:hypothetical protein
MIGLAKNRAIQGLDKIPGKIPLEPKSGLKWGTTFVCCLILANPCSSVAKKFYACFVTNASNQPSTRFQPSP